MRLLVVCVAYGIIIFITRTKKYGYENSEYDNDIDSIDMNHEFIKEKANTNKKIIDGIMVFSYVDAILLRSILYSCEINSFVQFFNVSSLRPGMIIEGYTDIKIAIFEDDFLEVNEIVNELNNQKINDGKIKFANKVRNIAEYIICGSVVGSYKSIWTMEISRNSET